MLRGCTPSPRAEWLAAIDYVLIARSDPPAAFDWPNWREWHRNHDYLLLARSERRRP